MSRFDDLDIASLRRKRGEKWTQYPADVLPAWVADMDFPVAAPISDFLTQMVGGNDLGYPINPTPSALPTVFAKRALERFGWNVDPHDVLVLTDVVQAFYIGLHTFSEPGDGVVVQTPVYPPILNATADVGRRRIVTTLVPGPRGYEIDFDDLRAKVDARARIFMLCNPQNPTGRAFTRAELESIARLAIERDLIVISDEVHADLVFPGHTHIPIASLGPEIAARTLTLMSATKAFNIAGLRCAVAIFGSESLKTRFRALPSHIRGGINSFGLGASEVAWTQAQPWLDEVMAYLDGNRAIVADFVKQRLPGIRHVAPQATYLAWLDCRALALPEDPFTFFLERARVALSDGRKTGQGGEGHVRLNFATSRPILQQILERLEKSLARG
jgi:cystathionine beta-lyase